MWDCMCSVHVRERERERGMVAAAARIQHIAMHETEQRRLRREPQKPGLSTHVVHVRHSTAIKNEGNVVQYKNLYCVQQIALFT